MFLRTYTDHNPFKPADKMSDYTHLPPPFNYKIMDFYTKIQDKYLFEHLDGTSPLIPHNYICIFWNKQTLKVDKSLEEVIQLSKVENFIAPVEMLYLYQSFDHQKMSQKTIRTLAPFFEAFNRETSFYINMKLNHIQARHSYIPMDYIFMFLGNIKIPLPLPVTPYLILLIQNILYHTKIKVGYISAQLSPENKPSLGYHILSLTQDNTFTSRRVSRNLPEKAAPYIHLMLRYQSLGNLAPYFNSINYCPLKT